MLHCRQMLVPLSWPQNQEMAPTTQGVCSAYKTAAGNIKPLLPLMYYKHDIGGEGGGGEVGEVMV
eukprot:1449141-Ditylum_brightwellii.AAC.1